MLKAAIVMPQTTGANEPAIEIDEYINHWWSLMLTDLCPYKGRALINSETRNGMSTFQNATAMLSISRRSRLET